MKSACFPCRAGHYCPSSGVMLPCPLGSFCPKVSCLTEPCPRLRLRIQSKQAWVCVNPKPSLGLCYPCVHLCCPTLLPRVTSLFDVCCVTRWQGSIGHTTCEYQRLLDQAPDTIIPARPFTVWDRVYNAGDPLGGNICPFNSSTPLQPCKKV